MDVRSGGAWRYRHSGRVYGSSPRRSRVARRRHGPKRSLHLRSYGSSKGSGLCPALPGRTTATAGQSATPTAKCSANHLRWLCIGRMYLLCARGGYSRIAANRVVVRFSQFSQYVAQPLSEFLSLAELRARRPPQGESPGRTRNKCWATGWRRPHQSARA